jgi:hypothetical protein
MERERIPENERQAAAWVEFGGPGHEWEYVLSFAKFDDKNFIPGDIQNGLKEELGTEWAVDNRGTRIEIVNNKKYGKRDDDAVRGAIKKVLTSHGYFLKE